MTKNQPRLPHKNPPCTTQPTNPHTKAIIQLIQTALPNQENWIKDYFIDTTWLSTKTLISLIQLTPDPTGQPVAYHYNTIFVIHQETAEVHHPYSPPLHNNYPSTYLFPLADPDSIDKLKELIKNHQVKPHPDNTSPTHDKPPMTIITP